MEIVLTGMQEEALDLLTNGPSSFAALYRTTLQEPTRARPGIAAALADLRALSDAGLVVFALQGPKGDYSCVEPRDFERLEVEYATWLGGRPPTSILVEETSVDEIGLWMRITNAGLALWRHLDEHS